MRSDIKEQWIGLLRSGEIPQSHNQLRTADGMCCLGVLCELHRRITNEGHWEFRPNAHGESKWEYVADGDNGSTAVLPDTVMQWAGLPSDNPEILASQLDKIFPSKAHQHEYSSLASLNDNGHSFADIARVIEEAL